MPIELSTLISRDLALYEKKKASETSTKGEEDSTETVTVTVTTTTTTTKTVHGKKQPDETKQPADPLTVITAGEVVKSSPSPHVQHPSGPPEPKSDACIVDPGHVGDFPPISPRFPLPPFPLPAPLPSRPENTPPVIIVMEDENLVYLGLRVYTKDTPAAVGGQLYYDMESDSEAGTRPPSPAH